MTRLRARSVERIHSPIAARQPGIAEQCLQTARSSSDQSISLTVSPHGASLPTTVTSWRNGDTGTGQACCHGPGAYIRINAGESSSRVIPSRIRRAVRSLRRFQLKSQ
jgi:hypothetical protein